MRTWLTERLGIHIPVVCAPMAGVAGGELALAVSRAGGLGMLGVGDRTPGSWIREQCAVVEPAALPYGIGLQSWAQQLNPDQIPATLASAAVLVSLSYGPYADQVEEFRAAGRLVATAVGTPQEAREAEDVGVDLIVARGAEGGGHGRDAVSTLVLLQAVLDTVRTPVVAAGGIAGARGLAAVVAAGAAGAWVGTAFTATAESMSTSRARERLVAAAVTDTVYTRTFDIAARARWPRQFGERALRNGFSEEWSGRDAELEASDAAARRMSEARAADDYDTACLDAGEGVGLITDVRPAADVVADFAGAADLLRRAGAAPS
jgi:nitronate monooxygenase